MYGILEVIFVPLQVILFAHLAKLYIARSQDRTAYNP